MKQAKLDLDFQQISPETLVHLGSHQLGFGNLETNRFVLGDFWRERERDSHLINSLLHRGTLQV